MLKSKANPVAVVQPEHLEFEPVEWTNMIGGKVQGNTGWAVFPLADVRELPAGEIDIVLVTQAGERRCKVGIKDRVRLLPRSRP